MNVIFDTSVWIEFFKGNKEYFDRCRQLIERGEVLTIELIFAELLQGARDKKEIDLLKSYYDLVPKAEIEQLSLLAGEFSQKERLINKGIGLIDACIIAATIATKSKLWTLDKKIVAFLDKQYLY